MVTLLLTPADAEKMTLASEEGRIMLALRNPLDTAPTQTEGARMNALLGEASPPPVKQVVQGRTYRQGCAGTGAGGAENLYRRDDSRCEAL